VKCVEWSGYGSGLITCEKVMAVRTILRRCFERKRERFRDDEVDHEQQREDCRERERELITSEEGSMRKT
jgi:hypothetical protein